MKVLLTLLMPLLVAASPAEDFAAPYRILEQANRTLDYDLATSAYTADGLLAFDYPGLPKEEFRGRESIRSSYVRTFGMVDRATPIGLEFRFHPPGLAGQVQSGIYRATATVGGRKIMLHGRFTARLQFEGGAWRFAEDRGTSATAAEFEALPPSVLIAPAPAPAAAGGPGGDEN
jgi:hypothetical protein